MLEIATVLALESNLLYQRKQLTVKLSQIIKLPLILKKETTFTVIHMALYGYCGYCILRGPTFSWTLG